ncbi:MAG TPA: response regulator [Arachnia sp.]|nr:response regulator [Arachnia sp.]
MVNDVTAPPLDMRGGADSIGGSLAARSSFLSHVSHELRTPLTLITGPLDDVLARDDLAPEARRALELARRSAGRMIRMVDAMLDFSRLEAGRFEPSLAELDVAPLLRTLVESFEPTIRRAGLELKYTIPDLPRLAVLDPDMVERMVLNLLANAVKYTPNGSITVELVDEDQHFHIAVSDTGTGIAPEDQERVFRRFEQVAPSQGGRSPEGVGIGLPMVNLLVRQLGGEVSLHSELGLGSTFTLTIPYVAHLGSNDQTRRRRPVSRHNELTSFLAEMAAWRGIARDRPPAEPDMDLPRLLLVEDSPDMSDYLAWALGDSYAVVVARDGVEALERMAAHVPDIVLADVMMPRMDGYSLVEAIRDEDATTDLPIVLLTAQAGPSDAAIGLEVGADDYLTKPFSLSELRARLAAQLSRARERTAAADSFAGRQANLQRALEGHRVVGQAIGILVERHRISANQAFDLLRAASQRRNVKLREIALRVLETGLDPEEA